VCEGTRKIVSVGENKVPGNLLGEKGYSETKKKGKGEDYHFLFQLGPKAVTIRMVGEPSATDDFCATKSS